MKLKIKVHPGSSSEKIVEKEEVIEVWLKEKAIENKANVKLEKLLQKYFKRKVEITSGFKSKNKIIEIK